MQMRNVNSGNVHSIGYDEDHQGLQIRYRNGDTFIYYGVPYSIFSKLRRLPQMTVFINKELKGKFQSMKVAP